VIITLADDLRIEGEGYAWAIATLQKPRLNAKTGQIEPWWLPVRWFPTLAATLRHLLEDEARKDPLETESLQTALDRLEWIAKSLQNACQGLDQGPQSV
jgi:hypothetical protein